MWLFPWLSYLAIAGMLLVLVAMALTPSHRAEFWTSVISISIALLAFVAFRRRGAPTAEWDAEVARAPRIPGRQA